MVESTECPWAISENPGVWLDFGGTAKTDTMYCCGPTIGTRRSQPLSVDGINLPLVEDELFRKFYARLHSQQDVYKRQIQNGDVVTPYGANVTTIINAISMARESLDGSAAMNMTDDEGIFNSTTGDYTLAPVDSNAVAFSRTASQVLAIAYLNAAGAAGGFFPNGVNGKVQFTSTAM